MQNVSSEELLSVKNKAITYLEKSVYMLATLLGIDPDELSSSMQKPAGILNSGQELAFESLINQFTILEGLRD
jgi:hypothetical protein